MLKEKIKNAINVLCSEKVSRFFYNSSTPIMIVVSCLFVLLFTLISVLAVEKNEAGSDLFLYVSFALSVLVLLASVCKNFEDYSGIKIFFFLILFIFVSFFYAYARVRWFADFKQIENIGTAVIIIVSYFSIFLKKKSINEGKIKILFILTPIICLLCVLFSYKTPNGIDSIKDYETVFQSVDELNFYIGDNNFYSTKSPKKDLKTIKQVEINTTPISNDRSKGRDFEHKIIIDNEFIIYINNDFSEIWLDDTKNININYNGDSWGKEEDEGILPSFSYTIENPDILKELFQQNSQHLQ